MKSKKKGVRGGRPNLKKPKRKGVRQIKLSRLKRMPSGRTNISKRVKPIQRKKIAKKQKQINRSMIAKTIKESARIRVIRTRKDNTTYYQDLAFSVSPAFIDEYIDRILLGIENNIPQMCEQVYIKGRKTLMVKEDNGINDVVAFFDTGKNSIAEVKESEKERHSKTTGST